MIEIAEKCKLMPKLFTAENGVLDSVAFLKVCGLFVGTDSGAMHLAVAVGTKCVGVFDYTDPLQLGPAPLERHVIIKKNDISQVMPERYCFKNYSAVRGTLNTSDAFLCYI